MALLPNIDRNRRVTRTYSIRYKPSENVMQVVVTGTSTMTDGAYIMTSFRTGLQYRQPALSFFPFPFFFFFFHNIPLHAANNNSGATFEAIFADIAIRAKTFVKAALKWCRLFAQCCCKNLWPRPIVCGTGPGCRFYRME